MWLRPLLLALLAVASCEEAAVADPVAAHLPLPLTAESLDASLSALPTDSFLLMELFAPWCPVCQRFRPHYERVASRFNGRPPSASGGVSLLVTTVDCVAQQKLCARFKVAGFPTLRFGHPADFLGSGQGTSIDSGPRTAETLLAEWTLDVPEEAVAAVPPPPVAAGAADVPPPPTGDATPALLTPAPGVDLGDVELATLIAFEHALSTVASASPAPSAAVTADLLAWLDLLSVAHPLAACAAGAAALGEAVRARTWPPPGASSPDAAASTFRPCGVDRPRPAGWGACATVTGGGASSPLNATAAAQHPPRGGFACGLWTLLHSLAARADGSPGGRGAGLWLAGARGYVRSFFPCSDCAAHFLKRTSDEDIAVLIRGAAAAAGGGDARAKRPASSKAASSAAAPRPELLRRHAASVAAWRVHNDVSARVAAEEAADAASLASARPPAPAAAAASPFVSSKAPWPPASLCAACVCAPVGGTGAAPAVAGTTAAADALAPRPGCEHPLPGAPAGGVWDVLVIAPFLARFYGGSGAAAPAEWDPFGLGQALSATHIPHHGGRAQRRRPSGRSLDAETAGAGAGGAAHAGHIEVDASPVSSSSSAGLFAIVLLVCVVIAAAMAVAVSGARKGGGRGRGNSPRNGMSSSSHGASWLKAVRRWIVARAGGRRHHHSGDGLGILGRAGVKSV